MITLQEARQYLRIDDWYTEEDTLLTDLISTAQQYVLRRTGYRIVEELPADKLAIARQAVRLLVGHYWRTRSEALELTQRSIPHGVESLCQMIERFNV